MNLKKRIDLITRKLTETEDYQSALRLETGFEIPCVFPQVWRWSSKRLGTLEKTYNFFEGAHTLWLTAAKKIRRQEFCIDVALASCLSSVDKVQEPHLAVDHRSLRSKLMQQRLCVPTEHVKEKPTIHIGVLHVATSPQTEERNLDICIVLLCYHLTFNRQSLSTSLNFKMLRSKLELAEQRICNSEDYVVDTNCRKREDFSASMTSLHSIPELDDSLSDSMLTQEEETSIAQAAYVVGSNGIFANARVRRQSRIAAKRARPRPDGDLLAQDMAEAGSNPFGTYVDVVPMSLL